MHTDRTPSKATICIPCLLAAVRDFNRDGSWSTHDVSVRKKMGGNMRRDRQRQVTL